MKWIISLHLFYSYFSQHKLDKLMLDLGQWGVNKCFTIIQTVWRRYMVIHWEDARLSLRRKLVKWCINGCTSIEIHVIKTVWKPPAVSRGLFSIYFFVSNWTNIFLILKNCQIGVETTPPYTHKPAEAAGTSHIV